MGKAQRSLQPPVSFAGLMPTQFAAPRVRPHTLARTALVGKLNNATAPGQVTLLVAGAGWGKSTLLALWHARDPRPDRCGWFSIDSTDNEPGRFWTGTLAAFATIDPGLSAGPSRLLAAAQRTVLDDLVPSLVTQLMGLQEPATLVIDDYHLIRNRKIQQSLRSFVEHLPPMLQLVISSRSRPGLPVARLRARGQLVDLGIDALRLSRDEAAELVREQNLTQLTEGEIDILFDRTEGWVAGLHLALLSMGADANPHELVADFGHADRGIGDYLRDEVLHRQPPEIQRFLQQTSILNSLTPSACDAVTGRTDSSAMLERIEAEQLFLVPLDNERSSYRYHHLFNDVLEADLHRSDPVLAAESHHRAAEWHREDGDPVEAVRHALTTLDRTLATELIASYALATCFHGDVETALAWLHALGDYDCQDDVRLCLARAAVAFAGGRNAEMNRWAGLAELAAGRPGVPAELVTSTRALIALTKWSSAYSEGQITLSLRVAKESNRHGEVPAPWRASAHTVLGWSLYRIGQFRPAQKTLSAASVLADADGDALNVMIANGILAIIAAANGLFHEVDRLAAQAERASANNALDKHFDNWGASFARGWWALSQQNTEQARTYFEGALERARRGPRKVEIAEILTALSMAEESLGDLASSSVHLVEAQNTLRTCVDPGYLLSDPRNRRHHVQEPSAAEPYPGWINLTEAELLIARLVAEGLTNRAIASRLSLSQHTIDSHLKHTFTKLDIRSRVQLTRAVLANGP
jgi:ATP/maltotriose-dependent transcriptional regulator MalT